MILVYLLHTSHHSNRKSMYSHVRMCDMNQLLNSIDHPEHARRRPARPPFVACYVVRCRRAFLDPLQTGTVNLFWVYISKMF
jgi:hypothetical protein